MESFILKENVLTDDILHVPNKGKVFKGNYIGIVEQYTFLNAWNDKKTVKRFRSQERLNKFLDKNYPNF